MKKISTKTLINAGVLIMVGFALGMVISHWQLRPGMLDKFPPPPFGKGPIAEKQHEEMVLNLLTERLDLNSQQRSEVTKILSDGRKELKALHEETFPKFEEIREHIEGKIRSVLGEEQIERFDLLNEEIKRQRPQGPPAPR